MRMSFQKVHNLFSCDILRKCLFYSISCQYTVKHVFEFSLWFNYFFKNLFQLLIEYDTAGALFSDRIVLPNLLDATVYTQSEDDR